MALTDENSGGFVATMPMAPAYGGGYGNGGFGGFGGDMSWLILLLLCCGGGWGGFGGFGGMGGFGGAMWDFPWLINGQQGINNNVSDGFRSAQLSDGITSIRDGISGLSTQLCGCCGDMQMGMANGFAGVQQSLCNGFAGTTAAITGAQNALTQQMYTSDLAALNRSFAEQTANTQGFNAVQSQLAQCCCDNRLATNDLKYTIATENCADRAALSDGIRDILAAQTAGIQSIKDQLCSDKIDAKNDEIAQLRQELLYSRGQAAAVAQNSAIINGVYNRLNECPVGTVPVYGEQPIFTCNNNRCGCGCGNNGF